MSVFTIKQARAENAARLTEIAFAAKRHWGYPEEWIAEWEEELTVSPKQIQAHATFLAVVEDVIAGFCMVIPIEDKWEMEHMWIDPTYIGQGIGSALFKRAIDHCRQIAGTSLFAISDPHALPFYLKMGCIKQEERPSSIPGRSLPLVRFDL